MCGFAGFSDRIHLKKEKENILHRMTDRIIHRGPDMEGHFLDDDTALGFRRLSIIDLSEAGKQPMCNEDGSIIIVFNGEIYNFEELRNTLIACGHEFRSHTDSEVLLHGYEEYGIDLLSHLRGMFSFVIRDQKKDLLFGARDIFGIKPHYYTQNADGTFLFASEIKCFLEHPSFHKEVNPDALRAYMTFQYSSGEDTFFRGVKKLPPAHYYIYQNNTLSVAQYWDTVFEKENKSLEDFIEDVDQTVNESVRAHRISDVRVGSFLSGGVDSSYITASLMPDETFSVGFDHGDDKFFDETDYARELSDILGIKNYKKIITPDECFACFSDIQYHMDEPQSNPSSVPLYFLAGLAKEHVTVVLSGEGADEIFAGYDWYTDTKEVRKYKKLVPACIRRLLASLVKPLPAFKGRSFLLRGSGRPEDYFMGQALVFSSREAAEVLMPEYRDGPTADQIVDQVYKSVSNKDELTKKQFLDMHLWLPGDILLKADKMSMAHSLELRVPFLDKKVIEQAEKIPAEYKVNEIDTKYVLRRASLKTLPPEWANRKKAGFPVPIRHWICEKKYYDHIRSYFCAPYTSQFFHTDKILALLDDHYHKKANNGRKIWTVFTFLVWYERFFINEKDHNA
ncbi:MAG: asparagine synthase (glutamine-hydrolyzing) [Clostridia bacterium]|nr:asparagine synthase (glutamine-hydrolyzing) [Clostridia bacterium]